MTNAQTEARAIAQEILGGVWRARDVEIIATALTAALAQKEVK